MDLPADVSVHLNRFRDGLANLADLHGLYLYGSLTTGDFSPASSDIDLVAVIGRQPHQAEVERLERLHRDLASAGGALGRLNCLYVPAGTLADPERLHRYWYADRFTQWELKVMTMAELAHSGRALHGPWPPPGLPQVSLADLRAHLRDHTNSYWPEMIGRPEVWLQDRWVDSGLVMLPRVAAVLRDGELITKSEAIGRLADFGVPAWLSDQIGRRRAGQRVGVTQQQRLTRAGLAQQIMADGVRRLTAGWEVEMLARACASAESVLKNVTREQLAWPTPCKDWQVHDLIDHMVGAAGFFGDVAEQGSSLEGRERSTDGDGDFVTAFGRQASRVVAAFSVEGAMDRVMLLPTGPAPGSLCIQVATGEIFVHGWDLARAAAQAMPPSEPVARSLLSSAWPSLCSEVRNSDPTVFAPEIHVPPEAPASDRLVGFLGRDPDWRGA